MADGQRLDLRCQSHPGDRCSLEPRACFTPVESPESNGMAEAFVKTFKRDYIRINPLPDARTSLARIDHWMEDYNSEHPHPGWAIAHRESTLHHFNKPRVRSRFEL
jgi:transposase InsO family protein